MQVKYERKGNVAIFTLENDKVNQLTPTMHKQFHDHMKSFLADQSIHVGILTGAGNRAFCGGDDIKKDWGFGSAEQNNYEHFWPSTEQNAHLRPGWERELKHVERFKPIVGAVNGAAMGMGLIYLLCHTDIRIAVPGAKLGFPEIAYGMGGAGGTTQLSRHLPRAVAYYMLLTGEPLVAEDALKYDLVNEIVPPEKLMERAMEIAEKIAEQPPLAVRVEMEVFNRSQDLPRDQSIAFASHLYRLQRAAYLSQPGTSATPLSGGSELSE